MKRTTTNKGEGNNIYDSRKDNLLTRLFKGLSVLGDKNLDRDDYGNTNADENLKVLAKKDVSMKGYLVKYNKRFYPGKRIPKFYVLRSDIRTLFCYEHPDDIKPLEEMLFDSIIDVSDTGNPFTLEVVAKNKKKDWLLRAPDSESFVKWLSALNLTLQRGEEVDYDDRRQEKVGSGNQYLHDERIIKSSSKKAPMESEKVHSRATVAPSRTLWHTFSTGLGGEVFTIDKNYEMCKLVGTGAYGAVISATNLASGESVAIKKITNIFDDLVDAKRILREVRMLNHFNHKNITKLLDLPFPKSLKSFEDVYIITDLMETDLHQVIYSKQPISDDHIKYFIYQMLCALYHIHSAGCLHRDIKPSNILLNANCDLKVCDFGLARGGYSTENLELTEYVVTRWYRAPEIMLNCLYYTESVDIWSVGCILAEMLKREPLLPGKDYIHQLKLIVQFLGTPKHEDVEFVKNAKALRFLSRLKIKAPEKLEAVFPTANPDALDLLRKMLVFNPSKRISVFDALRHPYLSIFYDTADLIEARPFNFDFDIPDDQLTQEALMELFYENMHQFHPDF